MFVIRKRIHYRPSTQDTVGMYNVCTALAVAFGRLGIYRWLSFDLWQHNDGKLPGDTQEYQHPHRL